MDDQSIIELMAGAIVTTRNFCGNELEAAQNVAADHGLPFSKELFGQAMSKANQSWRGFQKQSGVKQRYWRY